MNNLDLKRMEELEALQKENIQLRRQNHELEVIAKESVEALNKQNDIVESLIYQRDSFLELAKKYAEDLRLNTFNK